MFPLQKVCKFCHLECSFKPLELQVYKSNGQLKNGITVNIMSSNTLNTKNYALRFLFITK